METTIAYIVKVYSSHLDVWIVTHVFNNLGQAKELAKTIGNKEHCQIIEKKVTIEEKQIKY